jgi:hypothetical protein
MRHILFKSYCYRIFECFLCFIFKKYARPYKHKVFKINYPLHNYVSSLSLYFTRAFSIFITISNFLLCPTRKVSLDIVLYKKVETPVKEENKQNLYMF